MGWPLPPQADPRCGAAASCPSASARSCTSSRSGDSGPEIAEELGIAHDTVRTHVRNAMEKIGARSRAHLVAKALGEGHALALTGTSPRGAA